MNTDKPVMTDQQRDEIKRLCHEADVPDLAIQRPRAARIHDVMSLGLYSRAYVRSLSN
jgi:hypothetical protein